MRTLVSMLVLLLLPTAVFAQVPEGKTTYEAVQSVDSMKKTIAQGIEGAVEDMSFITRPIARKKLTSSNKAFGAMTFDHTGSKITIQYGGRKPVTSKTDGTKVSWTREDGETFRVSQKVEDGKITQIFYDDDGTKTIVYEFSGDTMTMNVTLNSPKLAAPMKYVLKYEKS